MDTLSKFCGLSVKGGAFLDARFTPSWSVASSLTPDDTYPLTWPGRAVRPPFTRYPAKCSLWLMAKNRCMSKPASLCFCRAMCRTATSSLAGAAARQFQGIDPAGQRRQDVEHRPWRRDAARSPTSSARSCQRGNAQSTDGDATAHAESKHQRGRLRAQLGLNSRRFAMAPSNLARELFGVIVSDRAAVGAAVRRSGQGLFLFEKVHEQPGLHRAERSVCGRCPCRLA